MNNQKPLEQTNRSKAERRIDTDELNVVSETSTQSAKMLSWLPEGSTRATWRSHASVTDTRDGGQVSQIKELMGLPERPLAPVHHSV